METRSEECSRDDPQRFRTPITECINHIVMRYIIILLFFSFCIQSNELQAQDPSNANKFNYTVFSTGYYYGPDDNGSSTNHPTFRMKAALDNNDAATALISVTGGGASHSRHWDGDTPSRSSSGWRQILRAKNTSEKYYDYTVVGFDNNCGSRTAYESSCGFLGASNDGTSYRMYNRLFGLHGETGEYYNTWQRSNNIEMRVHTTWRYYNGADYTRPLKFDTLVGTTFRSHTNYNRRAPVNIARDGFSDATELGYENWWSTLRDPLLDNSPDVTYSFVIKETSEIDVNTNFSTTNFNTKIHIAQRDANGHEIFASNSAENESTNKARANVVLDPGTYYIVVEGDDGAQGKFFLSLSKSPESMTAGSIHHPLPWVDAGCELTLPIEGPEATSSFASISYDWHQIIADTLHRVFTDAGPSLDPAEVGPIYEDSKFVRIAKSENLRRYTDTTSIKTIPFGQFGNTGVITGRVTGRNGTNGVAGIIVHAIPSDYIHGNCRVHVDTTDLLGQFSISNLYLGLNGESDTIPNGHYLIVPEFEDHIFDPDTLQVEIHTGNPRITLANPIKDITTFFIRGRVTQSDANAHPNEICGVPGVRMFLKEIDTGTGEFSLWETDEDGYYSIAVQNQGRHTVRPEFLNHEFAPAMSDTLNVIANIDNKDFENIARQTITGSVRACGDFIFGAVELSIEDTLGCFKFRQMTNASGNFEIEVPAGAYNISITETPIVDPEPGYIIEDVIAFFNRPTLVDVSEEDAALDLVYRQKPIIEVQGIPTNSCGDMIMEQLLEYDLTFLITETNTDGCPLDTGSLIVIDDISGREQMTLPISNGIVQYRVNAGDPNFVGDNKKLLSLTARHLQDTTFETTTLDTRIIVTGAKQRESTFTTVSPEVPFFILRDPPGDGSYSYLEEETSSQLALGFSYLKGGSVNLWKQARVGTTFEAGVLGFSTETDVWGEIGSSTTVTASSRRTVEGVLTFSNGARYQTSSEQDPDVMGQGGDLYVGAAMSLRYAKADVLSYDDDACAPVKSIDLIMGDADLQTKFVYTEFNIRNSIIPSLEDLRDEQESEAERMYYQDQIDVWRQTLALNQDQKDDAVANTAFPISGDPGESSISWSGGTSQEYYSTTTASATASIEFNLEIEKELSAELGMNVGGSGRSGGGYVRTRMEFGGSIGGQILKSTTTGFVLSDDDNLDRFETTVLNDPVYNTPVFENNAAITSCPYEPGTSPIDGLFLKL